MAPLSPPPTFTYYPWTISQQWIGGVGLHTKLCVFCVFAARKRLSQLLSCGHTRDCLTAYLLPDNPPTQKLEVWTRFSAPILCHPRMTNWGRLPQEAEYSLLPWSHPPCFWDVEAAPRLELHAIQRRGRGRGQVNDSLTGRTYLSQQDWEPKRNERWTRSSSSFCVCLFTAPSPRTRRAARPKAAPDCTAEPVCISNAILLFQIFLFCFCGQMSSVQDVLFCFDWRWFGFVFFRDSSRLALSLHWESGHFSDFQPSDSFFHV